MNRNDFMLQMDRLMKVYGDKSYPDERTKIIWREMQGLMTYEFQDIVSELIASSATAPMITKFREAKMDLRLRNAAGYDSGFKAWLDAQPHCYYCAKSGAVTAIRQSDGTLWAFRCGCSVGQKKYPNFPLWTEMHDSAFERNRASNPNATHEGASFDVESVIHKLPDMPVSHETHDDDQE